MIGVHNLAVWSLNLSKRSRQLTLASFAFCYVLCQRQTPDRDSTPGGYLPRSDGRTVAAIQKTHG